MNSTGLHFLYHLIPREFHGNLGDGIDDTIPQSCEPALVWLGLLYLFTDFLEIISCVFFIGFIGIGLLDGFFDFFCKGSQLNGWRSSKTGLYSDSLHPRPVHYLGLYLLGYFFRFRLHVRWRY